MTTTIIALTLSLITGETKTLEYKTIDLASCVANQPYIVNTIMKEAANVYEIKSECKIRIEQ